MSSRKQYEFRISQVCFIQNMVSVRLTIQVLHAVLIYTVARTWTASTEQEEKRTRKSHVHVLK